MPNPFQTTRWSVIVAAGDSQTLVSRNALAALCETYWQPLYIYVRSRGYRAEEAQDLVQSFLTSLIERNGLRHADPERGKFRSFLLVSLKHFLSDEWDKSRAQKRGGGTAPLRLDFDAIEGRGIPEPTDAQTPDRLYDRAWALATLDAVLAALRAEYEAAARGDLFEALRGTLTGEPVGAYAELAPRLGMSEAAIKTAVHRLRKRYKALLSAQVAQTLTDDADPDVELRDLLEAVSA